MTSKLYLFVAGIVMAGAVTAAWLHPNPNSEQASKPQYRFVVSPGESPSQVEFDLRGSQSAAVDSKGTLVVHLSVPEVWRVKPHAYQMVGGVPHDVDVQFAIDEHGHVLFVPGSYDRNLPLILDTKVE